MAHRMKHAWGVLRTAACYIVFGFSTLALSLTVVPAIWIGVRDRDRRELGLQILLHRCCKLYLRVIEVLGILRVDRHGVGALARPGQLVVANHPTLIDVLVMIAHMPQVDCIVKQDLFKNPFLWLILGGAGYLPNTGGQSLLDTCIEHVAKGRTLLFFPEGTRSPRGGLGRFQRGAAHLALATHGDLLPVLLTSDPPVLGKRQPWYSMPTSGFDLRIEVFEPFSVAPFLGNPNRAVASRALTAGLYELFEKRLNRVRS